MQRFGGVLMPGRGPAPKENRVRRNKDSSAKFDLAPDSRRRGPSLPADLPVGTLGETSGERWHPRTVAWWDSWRKSAQAQIFTPTDWEFLVDTAFLHHVMWSTGDLKLASEVRLRVAKFGATPEDRQRLRMKIELPTPATKKAAPASVTSIDSRRSRLTKG